MHLFISAGITAVNISRITRIYQGVVERSVKTFFWSSVPPLIFILANALFHNPTTCYSIERWDKLSRYTEDGMLNIDNNPVENSIRPVAIGRKNFVRR